MSEQVTEEALLERTTLALERIATALVVLALIEADKYPHDGASSQWLRRDTPSNVASLVARLL